MSDKDVAWQVVFEKYDISNHDFSTAPFELSAQQIKEATRQRDVYLLCKQNVRSDRPLVLQEQNLFILPIENGRYVIVQGEGYIDLPPIQEAAQIHSSQLHFPLITSKIGNSQTQHLDFAYATSVIRTFMQDPTLVLTIRGRKYTPQFSFYVGNQRVTVEGVQTEVDAGYEGENQVVLVEAKNTRAKNTIIRQLYYPFRQWQQHLKEKKVDKPISTIFFERSGDEYSMWQFKFNKEDDYNSIELVRSHKFQIAEPQN